MTVAHNADINKSGKGRTEQTSSKYLDFRIFAQVLSVDHA